MLVSTRNIMDTRKNDIDNTLDILNSLRVSEVAIVKAVIVMMIYNMIEGVFSTLLQEVFDFFSTSRFDIEHESGELKNTISSYYLSSICEKTNKRDQLQALYRYRNENPISIPLFQDFIKRINLYSGNLDAKKIREISKMFDVTFSGNQNDGNLLYIKNIRNKLAHGEEQYSVACRDKTVDEMKIYMNSAYNYLNRVLAAFEIKYGI